MTDSISLTGVVATTPRHITTNEGLNITSFRLASSQRRFDKARQSWVEAGTNWYTVTAFRQLASNLAVSVSKGDRIVAAGRLRIREWEKGERNGTTIEIEADAIGHDLSWGSASFTKTVAVDSPIRQAFVPESQAGVNETPEGEETSSLFSSNSHLDFSGQTEMS